MAGFVSSFYAPSSALIALCQSQVRLLQLGLRVDWCGVYLTQTDREPGVVPLVVSPGNPGESPDDGAGFISLPQGAPSGGEGGSSLGAVGEDPVYDPQRRLVLPLMEGEEVLGVLVVDRRRTWLPEERAQLEAIASGLGIACRLDQQQVGYYQAWQEQRHQRQWEQQRWADLLHQLRNPLTALRTFSKLVLKRWQGDGRGLEAVQGIVREGEHLQALLVAFEAQQGTGGPYPALPAPETLEDIEVVALPSAVAVDCQPVALGAILQPILLAQGAIAEEKGITLTNLCPLEGPWGLGDPHGLREVLSNLLDNAVKYTPPGGQVQISCPPHPDQPDHWVGVAIADTGYGIPTEDQVHIFERHFRGRQQGGAIRGTGLGLAIVRDLIGAMKGSITVQSPNGLSSQGGGTTFTLWLPKAP